MSKYAKPVFLLKGIDIRSVLVNYLDGKYDEEQLIEPRARYIQLLNRTQDTVVGNTEQDEIFEKSLLGNIVRVYTTNSKTYKEMGETNKKTYKTPCIYCRRILNDDFSLGVITSVTYIKDMIIYSGYDAVCSVEKGGLRCAKTHLSQQIKMDPTNILLKNSMTKLNMLALLLNGENHNKLEELPDFRLLDSNGGSMSEETFFSNHKLVKLPNIIFNIGKEQWYEKK